MLPLKTLITAAFLTASALADSQIAVYWGQNGFSGQDRLATYCQNTNMDIVLLSFLNDFPDPLNVNFANQCGGSFPDSDLLHCTYIGEDIKTCQGLGKKVLLSMGGAYGDYGFDNTQDATDFADVLWNKFGGGSDDERPFDDAVVDGFDFDIESGSDTGYAALATALKTKFAEDSSKSYYLSAAPQCPYPDAYVGDLIANVPLDYIFIQFYNNNCQVQGDFNFDVWQAFAESAPNPSVELFVGVPGAPSDQISGFVTPDQLATALDTIKCDSNFAGVSLWDASGAYQDYNSNGAFIDQVKEVLDNLDTDECNPQSTTEPPSTSEDPTSTDQTSEDPTSSDPTSEDATTSDPVSTDATTSDPVSTDATTSDPVLADPATTEDPTSSADPASTQDPAEDPITSADPVSSTGPSLETSSIFYGNSSLAAAQSTQTVADIHTTVITITSCSENKCSATPVTTGYVVVTDVNTVYTTYCPLTNEASTVAGATSAAQSTVTVTTVCHEEKCQAITKTVPVVVLPTNKGIVAVGSTTVAAAAAQPSVEVSQETETYVSGDITSTITVQVTSTLQGAVPTLASASSAAGNGTAPVYTFEGGAAADSSRVALWTTIPLLMLAALF
ncbi:Chitinase 2 [Spathaspora sp. JA1]|nr:Chitinase 2 [Spathaspora sp. JA1]